MIRFLNTTGFGDKMSEEHIKKLIDICVGSSYTSSQTCDVEYVPTGELTNEGKQKKTSKVVCPGYITTQKPEIKKLCHLAVIDQGEGTLAYDGIERGTLYDVPFEFVHLGKCWVLRGAILGDGMHFTAVARLPNCWMHYDGMSSPMLQLHSLDRKGSTEAMHDRGLGQIFYEVLDLDETRRFGSEQLDPSTVFQYNTEKQGSLEESEDEDEEIEWKDDEYQSEKKTVKVETVKDSSEDEAETIKDTSTDKVEAGRNTSEDELPKEKVSPLVTVRIPSGWSSRAEGSGRRGPLPTCRGCKGKIRRDGKCIRHSYKKKFHTFSTIEQYHCRVVCLEKANRTALKKLAAKHWTDKRVATVVKKLESKLRLSM